MENTESRREVSPRNTTELMAGMEGEEGGGSRTMHLLQEQNYEAIHLIQEQV